MLSSLIATKLLKQLDYMRNERIRLKKYEERKKENPNCRLDDIEKQEINEETKFFTTCMGLLFPLVFIAFVFIGIFIPNEIDMRLLQKIFNYFNSRHLDYNGCIEKGIAVSNKKVGEFGEYF